MTTPIASGPPPVTPPPALSPGARTAIRVALIALSGALITGLVVALSGAAWGLSSLRVVKDSATLPTSLTSVTVDTGSVPAAVRITTDREVREPRVDMRMVNSTRAGSEPLSVTADGTDAQVTIDAEPSELLQWTRAGEVTVVLPPELARRVSVTTRQETGVLFAQADIDRLTARTVDGAVIVSGSARRVDITNEHGDVTTRGPITVDESFSATTTTGDISVKFAAPPATVDAHSEHGDVVVSLPPPGPYFVDASGTEHGETVIKVPTTRDRDSAASAITARSETGDIVVNEAN
ncbi:DUF4097 family beta strand repeat-containing protein [Mycolicibacterium gilvum]|uniref:DUF4097 domain-containing protein n=1 Tax=Mycolicibacterium gilvum TaxID=1804 RepID=A0A378SQ60_9MYCO|nr:DUF4097 family beta strand repeat-containing protein [Mycolicibacterium gilvum]MCV7054525.1 DUF4097 family beta strand repeat protein [Mycolicibacterium gilvum]STZ44929.1 Uncharacterised protein [Mycolicibacterium gilvum]